MIVYIVNYTFNVAEYLLLNFIVRDLGFYIQFYSCGGVINIFMLQVTKILTENDLASILDKVWDGRAKWYNIGLQLGLTAGTLDAIQKTNYNDTDSCFRETLKKWLRSTELNPSWCGLAKALRAPSVGREDLAKHLDPST